MYPGISLVYDGECGFCRRSLRILKAFDWLDRVELIAFQDRASWSVRFPQLSAADFSTAMYGVSAGAVYRGFDAFRAALWSLPATMPLAWTWYLPGVRAIGTRVYDLIATRRHSLGCGDACKL